MTTNYMQEEIARNEQILAGKKILIVEDDLISAEYLLELLEDTGAELTHVIAATDAIDVVNSDNCPDLILMDIQLPDMNGWQATKIIKRINKNIPIIVQSAYAMDTYIKKSEEAGCDYFIPKPVNSTTLFKYISKLFC